MNLNRNMGRRAFTLIELLTVIAIIGILASIIIPTVGAVKTSAKKAKVLSQFSQWSNAFTAFRQEYGYYPEVTTSTSNRKIDYSKFIGSLTGKDYTGTPLALTDAKLAGNKKRSSFYAFSDADILRNASGAMINEVVDAFGNSDIVMLIDSDADGVIKGTEFVRQNVTPGNSVEGTQAALAPVATNFPADGIRAGVLFYSAGKGTVATDIVYSWK